MGVAHENRFKAKSLREFHERADREREREILRRSPAAAAEPLPALRAPFYTVRVTEDQLCAAMDLPGYSHVVYGSRRERHYLYGNREATTVEVFLAGTTLETLRRALRTLPGYMQGINIPKLVGVK
jgi:hypothetical protein